MKRLARMCSIAAVVLGSSVALAPASIAAKKPIPPEPTAAAQPTPAVMDSLNLLERAVARDSSNFDNLFRLGVLYMDRDRISEASRVFMKAHLVRPTDVHTLVNYGVVLDAAGSAMYAQKYYDEALALAPGDSVALCRKASSIYGQARYDEAMTVLRQVIAATPRAYCAYFTLGVAFADAGLYRDAIRQWRKVVELAPTSPEAISARESIEVLEKFLATPAR